MNEILNRVINIGDIVIGMTIGRNSDGMRVGVFNGKSVDFIRGNYIITSTLRNLYLVDNPTKQELEIKEQILNKLQENHKAHEEKITKRKALKRIPKSDLVIGEWYKDDKGNQFFYLGYGKVTFGILGEKEGYIYLRPSYYYGAKQYVHVDVTKTLRKIVELGDKSLVQSFKLDLNNLTFFENGSFGREIKIIRDNK